MKNCFDSRLDVMNKNKDEEREGGRGGREGARERERDI